MQHLKSFSEPDLLIRDKAQQIYNALLVTPSSSELFAEFNSVLMDILDKPHVSVNILRIVLRTLVKLTELGKQLSPHTIQKITSCTFEA